MVSTEDWALAVVPIVVAAVIIVYCGTRDRRAIRRDLAAKGCRVRGITLLPFRRGLLLDLSNDPTSGYTAVYGAAYEVAYINRDGRPQVAVCQMGPDRLVFWTDEHPEPGFDRHGNPPNLPNYGQSWRG